MISAHNITKKFHDGLRDQTVLDSVSLEVKKGEFVIVIGRSGAGKSTFLYQLSLLDHPTSGTVLIDGVDTAKLSSVERTALRLRELGYIFQDYALVPELSAGENIMLPLMMRGASKAQAEKRARETLARVGIGDKFKNLPSQLSGGEQQRVSVARAIASDPKILFADEPTANLDTESSEKVIALFRELHKEGQTIIMVTHEMEYTAIADRVVTMRDGKILDIKKNR